VTCAGVLLTGGASRRFGTDKATLLVDGETLARRSGRVLASVCDPVIEVGSGVSSLPSVREDPAGSGPLAAFLAGIDALGIDGPAVLLGCDLPFVDEATIGWVARYNGSGSVVPVVAAREQYACSRWSVAAIERAREAFAAGARALGALTDFGDVVRVPADDRARALADVDTPNDATRLGVSYDRADGPS
jgi:molybdopterin-guanine dinucleotide biosynthesis protein A